MPLVRVSEQINARIKELKAIRQEALGRQVTDNQVIEILFEHYDRTIEEEST